MFRAKYMLCVFALIVLIGYCKYVYQIKTLKDPKLLSNKIFKKTFIKFNMPCVLE